jgi:hypothetical protein
VSSCGSLTIERDDPGVGIERSPHRPGAPMEPRFGGTDRNSQDVGYCREGEALHVMEDDDGALFDTEVAERAGELVAFDEGRELIGPRAIVERDVVYLDGSAPSFALRLAMAGANEEPVQPGLKAIRVAEGSEVAPGGDERLLGSVRCAIAVAQDQVGDRPEPVDRSTRQIIERAAIAGHRLFHETTVHRTSSARAS